MTTSPAPLDPLADEQAALWAARLDGSVLSADHRRALDTWLAAQPHHRALLARYCQFSADLEQQLPLLAGIRELSAEAPEKTMTAQPRPWLRRPLMAGVALSAAAAVAVLLWLAPARPAPRSFATPVAQQQTLTLDDGSRVELNAQTNLQVEFTAAERHVRLADGEAFFAVSPDATRPFIIETPAGSVRVTGTRFNVRTENPASLAVTVVEGSVQVRPGTNDLADPPTLVLTANHHCAVTAGHLTRQILSAAELESELAWRQGQVFCTAKPLRDALARFARYHGRGITASPAVADLAIGGRFSLQDLDGFFGALEEIHPVKVTRALNGTILVESRRQP